MNEVYQGNDIDGISTNPHPDIRKQPDMPMGLSMALHSNKQALDYFNSLGTDTRVKIIQSVTCCETGEETKYKVKSVLKGLNNHNTDFLG